MTPFGAYDMAGNVREWCWNEAPEGRILRGGAWNDAVYLFKFLAQASPFERSPRNGFRCALYPAPETIPKTAFEMIEVSEVPDFYKVEPVSDPVFEVIKEQCSYDKTDLNARIEWRDESSTDWVQEKITFDAAYDNERVTAYLFLPRDTPSPYQTVIHFPGMGPFDLIRSSKDLDQYGEFDFNLSFIVKRGRAVLFPVYKGTFERGPTDWWGPPRQLVELGFKMIKDLKRSIDYLETRPDIDSGRLAFNGLSMGGALGAIFLAMEDRLKASILVVGGIFPDGDTSGQINSLPRVRIPTLMLNGRYDLTFPYETSVKPMFDLLRTPKEHKDLKLYETGHFVPRNELIKETLNWLDRYLGPVKRID